MQPLHVVNVNSFDTFFPLKSTRIASAYGLTEVCMQTDVLFAIN